MTQPSRRWLVCAYLFLSACMPGPGALTVQLVTDMSPGIELDRVRVVLTDDSGTAIGAPSELAIDASRSLGRPVRIARFDALAPATYRATLTALRGGRSVQSRSLRVRVEGDVVRTVLLTRDCGGVMCPGTGDPSAVACLGGRCVDPECTEEDPTACGPRACTTDAECPPSTVSCAPSRCTDSGVCVARPDDTLCGPTEVCDSLAGCIATRTSCDWSTTPRLSAPEIALDMPFAEVSLSLSHDGLDLYFTEGLGPGALPYTVHRTALDAPWGTPRTLDELHTAGLLEGAYTFRRDDLEVFFFRQSTMMPLADLYTATRTSVTAPWSAPVALTALNTPDYEFDTFLEADGLTLWFERQDSSTYADILRARRDRVDLPFTAAEPVPGLSTARVEANPTLPDDGSFVVLTTDGAMLDLAYAPIADGLVGTTASLDVLNTAENDSEPTVRFDGCELLFVSTRSGGMGGAAIYRSIVMP